MMYTHIPQPFITSAAFILPSLLLPNLSSHLSSKINEDNLPLPIQNDRGSRSFKITTASALIAAHFGILTNSHIAPLLEAFE